MIATDCDGRYRHDGSADEADVKHGGKDGSDGERAKAEDQPPRRRAPRRLCPVKAPRPAGRARVTATRVAQAEP